MKPIRPSLLLIFTLSLCALVSGCQRGTPEAMLENYQYRISNVLDINNSVDYNIETRPLFPHRRDRILPTVELREGLIDVLKLRDCGLLPLIAERNSALGKVYAPSQKMRYELRFYDQLHQCINKLKKNEESSQLLMHLSEIQKIKYNNLPAELWNGVFTSQELEGNFSRKKVPLPLIDNGSSDSSLKALKTLTYIIRTPLRDKTWSLPSVLPELEASYEILNSNKSGPKILSALQLITLHLNRASTTLQISMSTRQLCRQGRPSAQAKILYNVFQKYYIGEVQPYLAMIHKHANEWLDVNNHLIDSFKEFDLIAPKQFETYQRMVLSKTEPQSLWGQYITARNKHTQSWQKLLKQCGMMPTK